jgi:hypothetical protein
MQDIDLREGGNALFEGFSFSRTGERAWVKVNRERGRKRGKESEQERESKQVKGE